MCRPGCVLNKGTTVIAFAAMKRYQIFPFTLGFRRTKGKCPYQQIRRFFQNRLFLSPGAGFPFWEKHLFPFRSIQCFILKF